MLVSFKNNRLVLLVITLMVFFVSPAIADDREDDKKSKLAIDKVKNGLSVMVLGSGGPMTLPNNRAASGFMIFVDKKPRILMDAGGGVYKRIGDAGINIADLDTVLITHMHIDHMADLDAVVKSIYFHNLLKNKTRSHPIHFYGPGAAPEGAPGPARDYHATTSFVDGHFHKEEGLNRYLHFFAGAIGAGEFNYVAHDVSQNLALPTKTIIETADGLVVKAIGVPHGPVPALAFRVEYDGKSIVWSGDTSSTSVNNNMVNLSNNTDLLIYDTAILDTTRPPFSILHTTPNRIGEVADEADVKKLVLSHLTPQTENNLKLVKRQIREAGYRGKLKVAKDLKVYNLHDD